MHVEVIIVAGVVLAGVGTILLAKQLKKNKTLNKLSDEDRLVLSQDIDKGIIMEDEFVDTYYNLIKNEGYMHAFGGYEKQAHDLLHRMIEESKTHKASLLNIKKQLGL